MLYDIIVTNQGNGTADNVTVADAVPANTRSRRRHRRPRLRARRLHQRRDGERTELYLLGPRERTDNLEFSNDNGATDMDLHARARRQRVTRNVTTSGCLTGTLNAAAERTSRRSGSVQVIVR